MMRNPSPETKVTNYRMWKSGKQWLFEASLVATSLLVMNTQAFADDGNPVVSESTSMLVAPVSSENSTTPEGSKDVTAATNEAIVAPSSHNPVGPQVNADTSKDEETKVTFIPQIILGTTTIRIQNSKHRNLSLFIIQVIAMLPTQLGFGEIMKLIRVKDGGNNLQKNRKAINLALKFRLTKV